MFVYETESRSRIREDHCFNLDTNSHRHSLYEPPAHNASKVKRAETIHTTNSAGTNHTTSKATAPKDRHLTREGRIRRFT